MLLKLERKGLCLAGLLASFAGLACAADITTHALKPKNRTLDPASNVLSGGYYTAAALAAVDTDLTPDNIKAGVTIFGVTGTDATPPPAVPASTAPAVGGAWLLVPGDPSLGTRDFYVQKYEARDWSGVATSTSAGAPWGNTSQVLAENRCEALGPGYHLLTMPEVQTINRNIENNAWNWTGGAVGSGSLWRGHTDGTPASFLAADVTGDPDDDPYVGTGNSGASIEKRVHKLSSGQFIWDWSGNAWEWVDMTCAGGFTVGYWYSGNTIEWSDTSLLDFEKERAGPAGAYTSTNNAGKYAGCTSNGNALFRGGSYSIQDTAGVFAFNATAGPTGAGPTIGFRCGR